jgi:peptidyl-prolyl cis-trans isomerase C
MSINTQCPVEIGRKESGNVVVIVLVVIAVVAVGALAYMSGKIGGTSSGDSAAVSAEADAPKDAEMPNPVIAKVDGNEIKRNEVIELINMMPPQMQQIPMEQLLPIAVEQLVNNKIIDEKSSGSNLANDKDVKEQLEKAKVQLVRAKFVENAVKAEITEERLKTKYADYVKNFPIVDEVKAAHILVKDEAKAKEIIKELDGGKAFADLAKENSTDGTAKNGGDLGYFTKQDVVAPFAEAAFATKVGTYTKKPVKTDFGYHVIRIDEMRKRPAAEFEQAKPYLEQELRREILDEVVQKWRGEAKIERFDIEGKPLPEKTDAPAAEAAPAADKAPAAAEPAKEEKKEAAQ